MLCGVFIHGSEGSRQSIRKRYQGFRQTEYALVSDRGRRKVVTHFRETEQFGPEDLFVSVVCAVISRESERPVNRHLLARSQRHELHPREEPMRFDWKVSVGGLHPMAWS